MAVAGTWSNPETESLGNTYVWRKTVTGTENQTGVTYTVTARSNGKRLTSVTIAANATANDAKTGKTTDSLIKSFFADSFLPLLNSNMGNDTKVF